MRDFKFIRLNHTVFRSKNIIENIEINGSKIKKQKPKTIMKSYKKSPR